MLSLVLLAFLTLPASVSEADLPDPIYEDYDFFVVAGQSNARGRGTADLAPEVPDGAAYEVTPQGDVRALADPVGGANTGSAWPAFANAYSAATGRGVVIVGQATNGSGQVWLPGDGGNQIWDVSREDNLYRRTDRKARRALRAAEDALPGVRAAGWLWIQGGSDARRIEDGRLVPAQYEAALHALARTIGEDWGVPMYLFVSGSDSRGDLAGAVEVRRIQNEADALPEVVVVYRDAVTFVNLGWMQPDNIHWSQPGLNVAGTEAGQVAAADRLSRLETGGADPTTPDYSEGVVVFPNPGARPRLNAGCPYRYTVADTLGRRVAEGTGAGPTLLPDLPPGVYVAEVRGRAGRPPECTGTVTFTVAQ
ncbi:MAG: sialate O-acetylesterase [Bacteroidota bacterium]